MKQGLFAVFFAVIALAWGSLVVRRYQGAVAVADAGAKDFSTVANTLFNA